MNDKNWSPGTFLPDTISGKEPVETGFKSRSGLSGAEGRLRLRSPEEPPAGRGSGAAGPGLLLPASVSRGHPCTWVPGSGGQGSWAAGQHSRPHRGPTPGLCCPSAAAGLVSGAWCAACGSRAVVTARPPPGARTCRAAGRWRVVADPPPAALTLPGACPEDKPVLPALEARLLPRQLGLWGRPLGLLPVRLWLGPLVVPRPAPARGQNSKLDWTPGLCLERVSSCVTLGKLLSSFEPEFLHLQDGNTSTRLREL